ncbi:MAG TPA: SBBP repeat-containing protein [Flavobacteriales bacterium]|nr:SBBP repeat-containing protein [Flavobacteriales bacterium]
MRTFVLLLTSLWSIMLHAQQWNWAVDAGGGGNTDFCYDIATDSQGNAYWVGTVSGTADFGCATLTPGSTVAGVIAKYSAEGTCQWVRGITTGFYDAWVYGIVIDSEDRIYVTGSCQGNTDFGNDIVLPGSGSLDDWFTARYDTDGNCIWADRIADSPGTSEGRGIALDDDDGIFVTGFAGSSGYSFGDVVVNNGGFTRQAVIVKYDSTGTAQWARSTNGTTGGRTSARGISVAGDRLYITGQVYFATAGYQGLPITTTNTTSHAFILACDLEGEPVWARAYGGGDNEGFAVAADTLGNVFMTGRMWGSLYLEDDTLTSVSNDDDALYMGFDTEGVLRWAKTIGSDERDIGWSAVCDGMGNAYLSSHFHNTVDVFGTSITALGDEDALIMKVESDGDLVWASRPSGFQRDIPLAIHRNALAPHDLYFGGYFWGAITYGGTTIDDVLNGDAMMVMGVDTTFDASVTATPVCPTACDGTAHAFASGAQPFTYLWSNGATTSFVTGLCAGTQIVEVADAHGNVELDTVQVVEHIDPALVVQFEGDSLWIEGGSEWQWSLDGSLISAGQPYHIAEVNGTYQADYIDANSCMRTTDEISVVLNVGMDERAMTGLHIQPNPANEYATVFWSGAVPVQATLLNSTGQLVAEHTLYPGANVLELEGLQPGLYVLGSTDGVVVRVGKE